MQNTFFEIEYLEKEYTSRNISKSDSMFDFNIYPGEGYIPQCGICKQVYENYKNDKNILQKGYEIELSHLRCGCLWVNWFKEKFLQLNPSILFIVRKKK